MLVSQQLIKPRLSPLANRLEQTPQATPEKAKTDMESAEEEGSTVPLQHSANKQETKQPALAYRRKESDQALIYKSNRPLLLQEKTMKTIQHQTAHIHGRNNQPGPSAPPAVVSTLFSQRVQKRIHFEMQQKEFEQNQVLQDIPSARAAEQEGPQQPSQESSPGEGRDTSAQRLSDQKEGKVQISELSVEPKLKDISRHASSPRVRKSTGESIEHRGETGPPRDSSLNRKQSVKAQKALQVIRLKIQKSQRELEKNNVYQKLLKFELKDPNKFKEMLGIKKVVADQENNLNQSRMSQKQSFYNQNSQINQLMDQEQRGRTEMTMLQNLNKNMFYNRKDSRPGIKQLYDTELARKGSQTPESQFFSIEQLAQHQDGSSYQRDQNQAIDEDNLYTLNLTATQTGIASTSKTEETLAAMTPYHMDEEGRRRQANHAAVEKLAGNRHRSQMLNGFRDASLMAAGRVDAANVLDSSTRQPKQYLLNVGGRIVLQAGRRAGPQVHITNKQVGPSKNFINYPMVNNASSSTPTLPQRIPTKNTKLEGFKASPLISKMVLNQRLTNGNSRNLLGPNAYTLTQNSTKANDLQQFGGSNGSQMSKLARADKLSNPDQVGHSDPSAGSFKNREIAQVQLADKNGTGNSKSSTASRKQRRKLDPLSYPFGGSEMEEARAEESSRLFGEEKLNKEYGYFKMKQRSQQQAQPVTTAEPNGM